MIELSAYNRYRELVGTWKHCHFRLYVLFKKTINGGQRLELDKQIELEADYTHLIDDTRGFMKEIQRVKLSDEVRHNILNCTRSEQEYFYLKDLNDFISTVSSFVGVYLDSVGDSTLVYRDPLGLASLAKSEIHPYIRERYAHEPQTMLLLSEVERELRYQNIPSLNEATSLVGHMLAHLATSLYHLTDVTSRSKIVQQQPEEFNYLLHYGGVDLSKRGVEQPESETDQIANRTGLSATQKFLFIRLLQETGLFPRKPKGTDDAPELKGIALLTGLDYANDLKGSKGAISKVKQLLSGKVTPAQRKAKLADLDAVEKVAQLLNVELVVDKIAQIRSKFDSNQLD